MGLLKEVPAHRVELHGGTLRRGCGRGSGAGVEVASRGEKARRPRHLQTPTQLKGTDTPKRGQEQRDAAPSSAPLS
jgi:hypothetical protein